MARPGRRWQQKPPFGTPILPSHPTGGAVSASWALNEGGGKRLYGSPAHQHQGTFTGAPTWRPGPSAYCGMGLGGFTTSDYVPINTVSQFLGKTFPFWFASLASNTSTAAGATVSTGNFPGTTSGRVVLFYNTTGTNVLNYYASDDAGSGPGLAITVTDARCTDGLPHLLMAVSYSATDHRLYIDGSQVASSAILLGAMTLDRFTLGAHEYHGAVANPFGGVLYGAWVGSGRVPDPAAFGRNPWASYRGAVSRRLLPSPAGAATGGPWPWFLDNALAGGFYPMGL